MGVDVVARLTGDRLEQAWQLYSDVFEDLRFAAVQRHVMYRQEFDEVMVDGRVDKYVAMRDGHLIGLCTFTNDLTAVPLISPQYFQRHWPEHYAQRRIWYVGFVAVRPGAESSGVFSALVEGMYRVAGPARGMVALDFSRHNQRLARVIRLMLRRLHPQTVSVRLDDQSYWLYEFPAT